MDQFALKPFNWCSCRCERCPLAIDCPSVRAEVEMFARARSRGLDPDNPGVKVVLAMESLRTTFDLLKKLAEEAGIEESTEVPPPPVEGRDLAEAGTKYAHAVHEFCQQQENSALVDEAICISFVLAAKSARLTYDLPLGHDDLCRDDAVLNLLLIETLLGKSMIVLRSITLNSRNLPQAKISEAYARLDRELAPHLAQIKEEERTALADLVAHGRAPSPFCVTSTPRGASVAA
jgi:hypothetical protein